MEEAPTSPATNKTKPWKHYFLEFAMIFLAVTLGFFAESYRENLTERSHERQLIKSFIEDLKEDTVGINRSLKYREEKLMMMDSFMLLLRNNKIKGYENDLYYFGRLLVRTVWFQSNDRTISQFKNSDGSSLIQNEQAKDSIIAYYKIVEKLKSNDNDERTERYQAFPIITKMFDSFVFDQMVTDKGINRPTGNPPLRSYDPALQQDIAFWIHQLRGSTFLITDRLNILKVRARNTIVFLKKEYDLD